MIISLVMVVKNEAKALRACLESVKGIVDEWVICDTGSTDGTQEIIREYAGAVIELPWENYVTTKNKALELATGDTILFMDADERVVSGLARLREHAEAGADAVMCPIVESDPNKPSLTYLRARLWKNLPGNRFAGPGVHEVMELGGTVVRDDGVRVFHDHQHRTPESYKVKFNEYVTILKGWIAEHPTDARAWFYLGRTYKDLLLPLLAVQAYRTYLTLGGFLDERWQAAQDIAECYRGQGEYAMAREACELAMRIDPRRAETYCLLGEMAFGASDWLNAAQWYEEAMERPLPMDVSLFLDPRAYGETPATQLVVCYDRMKQYRTALAMAEKFPEALPIQTRANNLAWLHGQADLRWFFCLGKTPEPVWGGMLEQVGVGGVETTYLELPFHLAERGHDVFVFCQCRPEYGQHEHVHQGVRFIPYERMKDYSALNPQVVVTSRWFEALYEFPKAKRMIWLQDAFFAPPEFPDVWNEADRVVVSSPWHRDYVAQRLGHTVPGDKVHVIPLGIRKALFHQTVKRDPLKVIYSSNPDRGLYILMEMWDELTRRVPGIHLAVTYGWEGLKTWSGDADWLAQQEQNRLRVEAWARAAGNVRLTGRLRKADLAREMLESALCVYPCNFWETFCLTALECQAAGTPMITTKMGALPTTLDTDCNIVIEGDPFSPEYRDEFVERAGNLLTWQHELQDMSRECVASVARRKADWREVAEEWERMVYELPGRNHG